MGAAPYARVSTHDQQTLGLQVEAMTASIKNRGWVAARQIEDVGSGAKERSGRESLMKAVHRREIDVIVVWRLDRWGRSVADLMTTLREPLHLGAVFVSLTEALDLTTPSGRAMAGMLAIFAEFEREILRPAGPGRDRPGSPGRSSSRATEDGVAQGRPGAPTQGGSGVSHSDNCAKGSAGRRCGESLPRADARGPHDAVRCARQPSASRVALVGRLRWGGRHDCGWKICGPRRLSDVNGLVSLVSVLFSGDWAFW